MIIPLHSKNSGKVTKKINFVWLKTLQVWHLFHARQDYGKYKAEKILSWQAFKQILAIKKLAVALSNGKFFMLYEIILPESKKSV